MFQSGFQQNAFQNDAFQIECSDGFQYNAFQQNAFQSCFDVPPEPPVVISKSQPMLTWPKPADQIHIGLKDKGYFTIYGLNQLKYIDHKQFRQKTEDELAAQFILNQYKSNTPIKFDNEEEILKMFAMMQSIPKKKTDINKRLDEEQIIQLFINTILKDI